MATIITSYVNPDLDGSACAIAYAELLQMQKIAASAALFGTPQIEAQWVMRQLAITIPRTRAQGDDKIILVDTSDPDDIGMPSDSTQVIEVIDHRKIHFGHKFTNAKVQIELVGAAATLIAEKYHHTNTVPSLNSATLLHAAIISNTIHFKARTTTVRDINMARWLSGYSRVDEKFIHEMFLAKSDFRNKQLKDVLLADLPIKPVCVRGRNILIAQLEIVGAKALYGERRKELIAALEDMIKQIDVDSIFLSTIDLDEAKNYYLVVDVEDGQLVKEALHAKQEDFYYVGKNLLMRKEMGPILKEY